jgi:hypothetical protein
MVECKTSAASSSRDMRSNTAWRTARSGVFSSNSTAQASGRARASICAIASALSRSHEAAQACGAHDVLEKGQIWAHLYPSRAPC